MSCFKYTSPFSGESRTFDTLDQLYEYVIKTEGELYTKYTGQTLPGQYLNKDGSVKLDELFHFFANDYINSMHYMTLMYGDLAMTHKNAIDVVKRNGNLISAGEVLGSTTTKAVITRAKEIDFKDRYPSDHPLIKQNNKNPDEGLEQDIQDAQTYASIHWYMEKYLPALAKMPESVRRIYEKIRAGWPVTDKEFDVLSTHSATMPDRKIVVRDHFRLIKTSAHIQTREKVSYPKKGVKLDDVIELWRQYDRAGTEVEKLTILRQIHDKFLPIRGMEYHHEMLNEMERQGIGLNSVTSSSKNATTDVGRYNEETKRFEFAPFEIPDSSIREQVKTDSIKKEIVHGTQLQGLVWSEQKDDVEVDFEGSKVTLKEVREAYLELLSDRIQKGFSKKREEVFDEDGNVKYDHLWEVVQSSLTSSNPDPYLLELFKLDTNGKPAYSWNLSIMNKKLQNMYLSYVSKNALRHKVAGTTFTLVSSEGHNVLEEISTGKVITRDEYLKDPDKYNSNEYRVRELKFAQKDESKGIYYTECIVPRSILKRYGLKKGDEIPQSLAYMVGTRIPTQDKHSMAVLKIVDVLPDMYETSIIMPPEIIFLSGADFDIDKIFSRTYETYGEGQKYGSYLKDDNPVEKAWIEYTAANGRTMEIVEFNKKFGDRIKSNVKAYKEKRLKDLSPLTREETNNLLLELEMRLVMNEGNFDIAHTKASLDLLKSKFDSVLSYLTELGLVTEEQATGVASAIDKGMAQHNNDVGKKGIGPAALFNVAFQKMVSAGIVSQDIIIETENGTQTIKGGFFGQYRNFNDYVANDMRINDIISTVISAMTDNAKERLAAKYNLSTNTEGPFLAMIGAHMHPNLAALIVKQQAIEMFEEAVAQRRRPIKIKSQLKKDIQGVNIDNVLDAVIYDLKKEYGLEEEEDLNIDWVESDVQGYLEQVARKQITDKKRLGQIQLYAITEFMKAKEHSDSIRAVSKINSLIKGFKATFEEEAEFSKALEELRIQPSIKSTNQSVDSNFEIKKEGDEYVAYFKDGKITYRLTLQEGEDYDKQHLRLLKLFNQDKQQFTQVAAFLVKQWDAKKIFLRESDPFKELLDDAMDIINQKSMLWGDGLSKLKESLVSYLNIRAYTHLTKDKIDFTLPIKPVVGDAPLLDYLLSELRAPDSPFANMSLLKFIKREGGFEYKGEQSPLKGFKLFRLLGNTRTKLDPDFRADISNDYFTLAYTGSMPSPDKHPSQWTMEEKAKMFAIKLREYVLLMDNMQFKNAGLVKSLHPLIFTKYSNALRVIEDMFNEKKTSLFNGEEISTSYESVFGMSKEQLMDEFKELYALNQGYTSNLKFASQKIVNKGHSKEYRPEDNKPTHLTKDKLEFDLFAGWIKGGNNDKILERNHIAFQRTGLFEKVYNGRYEFPSFINTEAFEGQGQDKRTYRSVMRLTEIRSEQDGKRYRFVRNADGTVTRFEQDKQTNKYEANPTPVRSMPRIGVKAIYKPVPYLTPKHFTGFANRPNEVRQALNELGAQRRVGPPAVESTSPPGPPVTTNVPGPPSRQISSPAELVNELYRQYGFNGKIQPTKLDQVHEIIKSYNDSLGYPAVVYDYKTQTLYTDDDAINVRSSLPSDTAISILQKLSVKFGIPYEIDNNMRSKGEFVNGVVRINLSKMTDDTLFHEFAHPFIAAIKLSNPKLYNNLVSEIRKEGKILDRTRNRYKSYFESKGLSPAKVNEAIIEEAIVQALGEYAADFEKIKAKSKTLYDAIVKFLKAVSQVLNKILGRDKIGVNELDANMTLRELGVLLNSDTQITLPEMEQQDEILNQLEVRGIIQRYCE